MTQTPIQWGRLMIVLIISMLSLPRADAVELGDLYTTEVDYQADRRDGRDRAYRAGLATVLGKITGDEADSRNPEMMALFEEPADYVLGWREATYGRMWVSFDGVAIGALLRDAGFSVWGSDRPLTLVWLAVERRSGGREIIAFDAVNESAAEDDEALAAFVEARRLGDEVREQIRSVASARGLPMSLPLMDERDRALISDSDIWGGFHDQVLIASRRYGADSVLIGRAREGRLGQTRWTWLFAGNEQTLTGSIESVAGLAARRMAQQFASGANVSTGVRVSVVGVDQLAAFARVMGFLRTQSLLSDVRVESIRSDEVIFSMDAYADRERLAQLLDGDVLSLIQTRSRDPYAPSGAIQSFNSETTALPIDEPTRAIDIFYRVLAAGAKARDD